MQAKRLLEVIWIDFLLWIYCASLARSSCVPPCASASSLLLLEAWAHSLRKHSVCSTSCVARRLRRLGASRLLLLCEYNARATYQCSASWPQYSKLLKQSKHIQQLPCLHAASWTKEKHWLALPEYINSWPCNNARNGTKVKQNNNAIVILLDIIGAKIENLLITFKCWMDRRKILNGQNEKTLCRCQLDTKVHNLIWCEISGFTHALQQFTCQRCILKKLCCDDQLYQTETCWTLIKMSMTTSFFWKHVFQKLLF